MKARLFCLGLALWAFADHLLWFATGLTAVVAVPYTAGSTAFRAVILVCSVAGLRRHGCIRLGWRLISIYGFCLGAFVSLASSPLVKEADGVLRCVNGLWRVTDVSPFLGFGVAMACVGYLAVCSVLLPRTRYF